MTALSRGCWALRVGDGEPSLERQGTLHGFTALLNVGAGVQVQAVGPVAWAPGHAALAEATARAAPGRVLSVSSPSWSRLCARALCPADPAGPGIEPSGFRLNWDVCLGRGYGRKVRALVWGCCSPLSSPSPCPGFDMTPNYVDASPTGIVVSPWCSCRGSGNMEEECEKFLRDFTENPCLRKSPELPQPSHGPEGGRSRPSAPWAADLCGASQRGLPVVRAPEGHVRAPRASLAVHWRP